MIGSVAMTILKLAVPLLLLASPCFAQEVTPASASVGREYLLAPGDEVRITVFNEPDLGGEQTLSANGEISLPLIGDIQASGMTSAALSDALEGRLNAGYLRNSHVSVAVLAYRPIYVTGEVARPGAVPYTGDMSVTRAVASAGGFNQRANRSRLYLRRADALTEEEISADASVALAPGDSVRVGAGFLAGLRDLPLGSLLTVFP